jgi:hypothetical protein
MVLASKLPVGSGAALLSLALVGCSRASISASPPSIGLTPSAAPVAAPTLPPADPNGPDGGVERAYQAFERGDSDAFLAAIDPTVRDRPGPMEFGNLVILDVAGLKSELSQSTFSGLRYSVLSIDGEWGTVRVEGIAHSVPLGTAASIAGMETAHKVQGQWLLSTAQAKATAQAPLDSARESAGARPDPPSEGPRPAATPKPAPTPPYWRVVGEDGANLRGAPGRTAHIVRELPRAEVVANLDQEATADGLPWRKVAYGAVEGWVATELLAPQTE